MNNLQYNFQQNKTKVRSAPVRKLVEGVGTNDADYPVTVYIKGKRLVCPYYIKWGSMLRRCYSPKYVEKYPTYAGCTVCDAWLLFSNFRKWMATQEWEGLHLDKDIKVLGNKVYSPSTCLFLPKELNTLLNTCGSLRGTYPLGVTLPSSGDRFRARIHCSGKLKSIGSFGTPEEASDCYQIARKEKIYAIIKSDSYPSATQYLQQHI